MGVSNSSDIVYWLLFFVNQYVFFPVVYTFFRYQVFLRSMFISVSVLFILSLGLLVIFGRVYQCVIFLFGYQCLVYYFVCMSILRLMSFFLVSSLGHCYLLWYYLVFFVYLVFLYLSRFKLVVCLIVVDCIDISYGVIVLFF
jgi:hypothetical protein